MISGGPTARRKNRRRLAPVEKRERARSAVKEVFLFCARLIGAILFVGGVSGAVIGTYVWATMSPVFAVTEVRVDGNKRASLDEVAPLTAIEPGTNIFLVDTRAAERRLASHPWVRSVVVRRDPPNKILIAVREYEPAAVVALGSLYLADEEGTVFKRASAGDAENLPILSGIDAADGDAHIRAEIQRGLQLASRWHAAGLSDELELSQVHLDSVRGSTLTVKGLMEEDLPLVIHLAAGDVDARLSRLTSLLEVLGERGERPKEIFLDNRARPQWVVARVEE